MFDRVLLAVLFLCTVGFATFGGKAGSPFSAKARVSAEAVRTSPPLPKCWGTVDITESPWRLICQTPCFGGGCNKVNVDCFGETWETCACPGGGGLECCDVAEDPNGNGACAVGACGGSCPSGTCGLVFTEEDISAACQ